MKLNEKQFELLCKKLDRISVMIAIQNIENRDKKISIMKISKMTSKDIGDILGVAESVIRKSKGWKKK